MQLIKIDEAKAGWKLVRDVFDTKGNLLLKEQTVLTADLLGKIKSRNVTHIMVETSDGVGLSDEEIKKKEVDIDNTMDEMFSDVQDNPIMLSLKEAAKKVLKRNIK